MAVAAVLVRGATLAPGVEVRDMPDVNWIHQNIDDMELRRIHHAAIICSNYAESKRFYTEYLGLKVIAENYRQERDSYKLDLALPDGSKIELFSFPDPPQRLSYPEARGLRHLAFEVDDIVAWQNHLTSQGVPTEKVRIDEYTKKRFVFFQDPDGLPLELYEQ